MARGLWVFLMLWPLRADPLEDAARTLARRVAAEMAANETGHVTARNLSTLARPDAVRAQAAFEQAVRRRVRQPNPLEITFTISENIRGFLLIAEFREAEKTMVEMEPFRMETPVSRSSLSIAKRMVWQQPAPILDLVMLGDDMLVLDAAGVERYEQHSGKWSQVEMAAAPSTVRDPRGRMTVAENSLTVDLPGVECRGEWKPLKLECGAGSAFSAGRNTMEGSPAFFSDAQVGNTRLVARPDGRTYINDVAIENWGSDVAAMATCAGPRVVVTAGTPREANDSLTLYDVIQTVPIRVSDSMEFPGPITALWPRASGVMAVVRNRSTMQFEAYEITADCSR